MALRTSDPDATPLDDFDRKPVFAYVATGQAPGGGARLALASTRVEGLVKGGDHVQVAVAVNVQDHVDVDVDVDVDLRRGR